MHTNLSLSTALFLFFFMFFLNGCSSLSVVDINPEPLSEINKKYEANYLASIEPIEIVPGDYSDADKWKNGLSDAIRNEGIFESISLTSKDKDTDFIIRGKVKGKFRHEGSKNFFTWFPGPLVFAQAWRGTRYIYDAVSDIEMVDANSGDVLGNYHAESSYQLIHKSYNPWHFFGTIIVIPGTIKGSLAATPREPYRIKMYDAVYPMLWKKMAVLIKEDQSKIYATRVAAMQKKCGTRFNEDIKIDMAWSEFIACQTQKFKFLGKEPMESGLVSIYLKKDKSIRVHVAENGQIIRWYIAKHRDKKML